MTAVMLLPGMMCDARLWGHQAAALRSDGCEVTIGDLSAGVSMREIAGRVLESAPHRFALAGMSMGGIVALELWRQAPERVTHLALINTNPHAEATGRQVQRTQEIEFVMQGNLRRHVIDGMMPGYQPLGRRTDGALEELVITMAMDLGPEAFRRQALAVRDRPDSVAMLGTIGIPTLVLCGREDRLCPVAYHTLLAESIPQADLVVLAGCGHLSPIERSEAVTAGLRGLLMRVQSASQHQRQGTLDR